MNAAKAPTEFSLEDMKFDEWDAYLSSIEAAEAAWLSYKVAAARAEEDRSVETVTAALAALDAYTLARDSRLPVPGTQSFH